MADRNAEYTVHTKAVPRELFPRGVRFSLGVPPDPVSRRGKKQPGPAAERRSTLDKLQLWHAWFLYRAIMDGLVSVDEVVRRVDQLGRDAVEEMRREIEVRRLGEIPTYEAMVAEYLASGEVARLKPATRAGVTGRLGKLGRWVDPDESTNPEQLPLSATRFDQVRRGALLAAIQGTVDADSTRESYRSTVSGLYTWAIEREAEEARLAGRAPRWTENVAALVEPWKARPRIITASPDQVLRLLTAAEPYQEAYLRAFLQLGLREDELIHTRKHLDLNLRDWRWVIQARGPDPRHTCRQCRHEGWSPKTERSHRRLRIPATVTVRDERAEAGGDVLGQLAAAAHTADADALRSLVLRVVGSGPRRVANPLRTALTRYLELYPCADGDFFFRNPRTGAPWTAGRLDVDFRRLCERADVPYGRGVPNGLTIHSLRDTCATELVRAGVRESVIARLLGDTVETVTEWYVHLTEDDVADGVSRGPAYDLEAAA